MTTKPRLTLADIQARIGAITPLGTRVTKGASGMPDPGEIEADPIMQAFRLLGRVLDHGRVTTMGWGYDVECPWSDKHSSRIVSGTSYVPVAQKFKCHHGHCQDQGMAEVRVKLDELLRTPPPGGPGTTLAALEFDAVDPALLTLPGGGAQAAAAGVLACYEDTEDGLALAFADQHEGKLLFDHRRKGWFLWTGWFWRPDGVPHAFRWARGLARAFRAMQDKNAKALGKINAAAAIEKGARADEKLAVDGSGWDLDPWRVGAPGCEVNLMTGQVETPDPAHMITRQLLVAPGTMPTPVWDQFIWDSTGGDLALIRFLQAWFGYCLTGDTSEEKFVFIHGPGGNGKSTFMGVLNDILHDYAVVTPPDTFMLRKYTAHSEEIARLEGARSVSTSEIEEGATFNMVRLKEVTGRGGKLAAARKHEHWFEFTPQFKVNFLGNHQPKITDVDAAIRRRLVLVPFTQQPPRADTSLKDRLVPEYPGILQWAIEGEILRRAMGGLGVLIPASAAQATEDYLAEQDLFRGWVEDRCEFAPVFQMPIAEGFEDYREWCETNGGQAVVTNARQFARKFLEVCPQCHRGRTMHAKILIGARLLPKQDVGNDRI